MTRRYFEAIGAHDVDGAAAMWAPDGREDVRGQGLFIGPEGLREFIGNLVQAIPDLRVEIVSTTTEDDRCALHWRFSGTFAGPRSFNGIAPTGHRMELEGVDVLSVRDGLIQSNDAFTDTMAVPRQIGMMPPLHSLAEQRLMGAFNVKTRLMTNLVAGEAELVATDVWVVQGQPGRCNVYLIENGGEEARPWPHRQPWRGARTGRARAVPPRRGAGRGGKRGLSLLARRPGWAATGGAPGPAPDAPLHVGWRACEDC